MLENIADYTIVLASHSPRRRELLSALGLPFEQRVLAGIDESYPPTLPPHETAAYIANKKAVAYLPTLAANELLITADTVVVAAGRVLGKPTDGADAKRMLRLLSDRTHEVVTGVCLLATGRKSLFSVTTEVTFKALGEDEIDFYVDHYQPFDKAGAYGIQEWIGYIGCTDIRGSYYNVMGLPVQRIYSELQKF